MFRAAASPGWVSGAPAVCGPRSNCHERERRLKGGEGKCGLHFPCTRDENASRGFLSRAVRPRPTACYAPKGEVAEGRPPQRRRPPRLRGVPAGWGGRTPAPSPAAVCRLPAATSCLLITLKVNEGPRGSCCRRGVRAPPPGEPAGVSTWVSFPGHTREDGAS